LVNAEVDRARLRKLGQLSLTDHQHWNEIILKDHVYSLDSDLSMHLKFSMAPGPLFVPNEAFAHPGFEEFKEKVEKELAEQKAKQAAVDARLERIENKQGAIVDDLKKLLSLLTPKP
jgi:folylpolyglutamate synthase/dihydropteroate synthase